MKRYIVFTILGLLVLSGCGTKKRASTTQNKPKKVRRVVKKKPVETKPTVVVEAPKPETIKSSKVKTTTEKYIDLYSEVAKREMVHYGIPASITLAQGILESGSGNGNLTRRSNNHFGIKCHRGWKGQRVYHDDDEDQECFRKYKDPAQSFSDHSEFLTTRSRYAFLFKLDKDDYKGWAKGLRKAGYATDRRYPQKLIALIERYELYKYDAEVLGTPAEEIIRKRNTTNTYTVVKGDTLYSIARKYNISVAKLKSLNGLTTNTIAIGQKLSVE